MNTHTCQHLLALKQNHDEEYHKPSNDNLHFTETKQSRKELPLIDYISDVSCRCLLSIKQRDPSSTSHACFSLAVLSYGWANQGVTDWRFSGIKKLHQLPEVLESKLKSSQKNILKITSHTTFSSTTSRTLSNRSTTVCLATIYRYTKQNPTLLIA